MYFKYGEREKLYLSQKDPVMAALIEHFGHIERRVNPHIYSSLVHQVISQQISSAARDTIWARMLEAVESIEPQAIVDLGQEKIQALGMSMRKAQYIHELSTEVLEGRLNLEELRSQSDEDVVEKLTQIRGIGPWTAQMTLIFSLERPDVVSYGDFAIRKGMMLAYGLESLSKKDFDQIAAAYSPYSSVASLYLWEASGGDLPGGLFD